MSFFKFRQTQLQDEPDEGSEDSKKDDGANKKERQRIPLLDKEVPLLKHEEKIFSDMREEIGKEIFDLQKLNDMLLKIVEHISHVRQNLLPNRLDPEKVNTLEDELKRLDRVIEHMITKGLKRDEGVLHYLGVVSKHGRDDLEIAQTILKKIKK